MTTTATVNIARYARTFSATTRHIVRPDAAGRTLCGQQVALPEFFLGDDGIYKMAGPSYLYQLPACARCDASAAKRGITPDRRSRFVEDARAAALNEDAALRAV